MENIEGRAESSALDAIPRPPGGQFNTSAPHTQFDVLRQSIAMKQCMEKHNCNRLGALQSLHS